MTYIVVKTDVIKSPLLINAYQRKNISHSSKTAEVCTYRDYSPFLL